ncbi:nuclear transport factor 2 family protein [Flavobacterium sp. Root420]|uniref:nuclear transport factor 2 family protein n=1 Tax=Flavobacterium sp. Root420 TaxID=1736533 RepID=UPI0006FA73E1|nr:nuclear transport factor 2 family protein [Flavobacterium sp. Root420]KQW99418.1 hypothetical protein ASC72_10100 [Flavobacterium sp. Root420]
MTPKQVVELYSEALGTGDIPKAFSFFSADSKWHQPGNHKFSGTNNHPGETGEMLTGMMTETKGTFVIKPTGALMANGSLVAMPVHFTGENNGRTIDMTGIDLFEVINEKITQVWLFSDDQIKEDEFWGK